VQPQTKFQGRGVPDVAGDADPVTGYQVRVDGQNQVIGGTSAVAPLWAALVALMNEQLGTPIGFLNPKLYPLGESVFHDVTSGNNDSGKLGYYSAKTGWDPCTGLGSPNGASLLKALSGTTGSERTHVPGSAPKHGSHDEWSAMRDPNQQLVTASIILRPNAAASNASIGERLLSGDLQSGAITDPAASLAADPTDMQEVVAFVQNYGLTVTEQNPATRTLRVQGTAEQMDEAFRITLNWVTDSDGNRYLSYKGALSVPHNLSDVITAVLGLDQRPVAKHHASGS
jgi:subtilase family serine protease